MQIHTLLFPQPFGLESSDCQPQEALFQCMKLNSTSLKIRFLLKIRTHTNTNVHKYIHTQYHGVYSQGTYIIIMEDTHICSGM